MSLDAKRTTRRARWIPPGSLARRLVLRVFPAVLLLLLIDLLATWWIAQESTASWNAGRVFWLMVVGQIVLLALFAWVLVSGVHAGLHSITRLSAELKERSIEDLQPLDASGLPTEVAPLITHINELLTKLDAAVQAQKRFIGHAAHQLRTPLAGLRLESELMLARALPEDVRARAERIQTVTDRLIRMGQQLLVLARMDDSARPRDSFARTDLCEWVRTSGAQWIPAARARQVGMQLTAPEQPVWVDMDAVLMEELLGNLIDNALRYGRPAGHIRLQVSANPPTLLVEDDGPGVPPDDARRVFEAFYRAGSQASGSGLGLAIVREIARAHGAWWGLTSRPAFPGTRVSIVFPGPRIGADLSR